MKFNSKTSTTTLVENQAGGLSHKQSPELELVSILLTSFVSDVFYEKSNDTLTRLKGLIEICNPKFVAQAAIFARTKYGMRSISHVAASELAKRVGGQEWAKSFYNAVIHRPDDMTEILSYHKANNGKVTNAMKGGFALAFEKFDGYQIGKYKGERNAIKLVDAVNLCHPVPIEKNAEAIKALVNGTLKSTETWEAKLTAAGQSDNVEGGKKEAWTSLIKERKIGYLALLKNLRNIIQQAPECIEDAVSMLTDEKLIQKSLVLPFRYITAYDEMVKLDASKNVREVVMGLNKALDISLQNVPKFEGETLIVLDVSGSMQGQPSKIGSLFASVVAKVNNSDLMIFDTSARYVNLNLADSIITITNSIRFSGGGTDFNTIFRSANKKYDRIIILSDMQAWVGHNAPKAEFLAYKSRFNANPFIYSFDLNGLGTMQFPEQNVFAIAGFSDKIFSVIGMLETDKNALINEIKKTKF